MEEIRTQNRLGSTIACPECERPIRYTVMRDFSRCPVFFYSSDGTEILCRRSDRDRADDVCVAAERAGRSATNEELQAVYDQALKSAPITASGGTFDLWNFVHCPHCGHEFEYFAGVRNLDLRIGEYTMIIFDGVVVVDDDDRYRVVITDD